MFNKLSGWGGSAAADQEAPVSQEIDQTAQAELQTTPTKHMMESGGKQKHRKHHHREVDGTQEDGVFLQEGTVVKENTLVQGAEQSLHYLDGLPVETPSRVLPQETTTTYVQQEVMTPSPRAERTLAVYEPPRAEAPAASTTLVTVKSISAEERDRQIHEENLRRWVQVHMALLVYLYSKSFVDSCEEDL